MYKILICLVLTKGNLSNTVKNVFMNSSKILVKFARNNKSKKKTTNYLARVCTLLILSCKKPLINVKQNI